MNTPISDAAAVVARPIPSFAAEYYGEKERYVPLAVAQSLERENAELRAELTRKQEIICELQTRIDNDAEDHGA